MNGKIINFNISFDPEAGAMYIRFSPHKVARTIELKDEVFVDVDTKDNLIGIELLNPIKMGITLQEIIQVYKVPQLIAFDPDRLTEAFKAIAKAAPTN